MSETEAHTDRRAWGGLWQGWGPGLWVAPLQEVSMATSAVLDFPLKADFGTST